MENIKEEIFQGPLCLKNVTRKLGAVELLTGRYTLEAKHRNANREIMGSILTGNAFFPLINVL